MTEPIRIAPEIRVREQAALIAYYEERNLILSQAYEAQREMNDKLRAEVAGIRAELEALQATPVADASAEEA